MKREYYYHNVGLDGRKTQERHLSEETTIATILLKINPVERLGGKIHMKINFMVATRLLQTTLCSSGASMHSRI